MTERRRVVYFDYLNALACFAVVCMHVNSRFWSFTPDARWMESLVIESLAYPAVGLFLMMTGAKLIDYRERYSTREYVRGRVTRVVLPYVAWSLLAVVFHVMKGQLAAEEITPAHLCGWLLNGSYYSVYWFFPPLFACYAAIPVLGCVEKEKRVRVCAYMALLSFVTLCVAPMASRWTGIAWNEALDTPISGGYLLYPLLGYVLSRVTLSKPARLAVYALGVAGLSLRMVMTWVLSRRAGIVDYAYGTYLNFPCVLQTVAVFVWFSRLRLEREGVNRAMRRLSSASFTVYLCHKFVMDVLDRFALEPAWIAETWLHPLVWPAVVYALCVGVHAVGSRVPGVRRMFP